jgi:F0F1-type ATP synthase beta subunit
MEKYESLKNIIAIVGENELSPADLVDYRNAKKLVDFFQQDFNVAEHLNGRPGQYFTREQTLDGIEGIIGNRPISENIALKVPINPSQISTPASSQPPTTPTETEPKQP